MSNETVAILSALALNAVATRRMQYVAEWAGPDEPKRGLSQNDLARMIVRCKNRGCDPRQMQGAILSIPRDLSFDEWASRAIDALDGLPPRRESA